MRISPQDLSAQAGEFLQLLTAVFASGSSDDRASAQFKALQEFLDGVSRSRVQQGFSSAETAPFIFSFKQPLFEVLRNECGADASVLAEEIWTATKLPDELGLITVASYQRTQHHGLPGRLGEVPGTGFARRDARPDDAAPAAVRIRAQRRFMPGHAQ
jgi:rsbT co-antagonist protein RsbR